MSGQVFTLDKAVEFAKANGGATLTSLYNTTDHTLYMVENQPTDGYMVSVPGFATLVMDLHPNDLMVFNAQVFMPYYAEHVLSLDSVPFIGVWFDQGSEMWYLDVSLYVKDRADAIKMAQDSGELAIWDNEKREEIRVIHATFYEYWD